MFPSTWPTRFTSNGSARQNGRVVIESADYELTISAPEWRLTPRRMRNGPDAAAGMDDFMQKLTDAIEQQQRGQKDPEAEWDEHDYEKLMKESDARTDKYLELLDKYGDSDEAEEKIAQEMGWDRELTREEAAKTNAANRRDESRLRGSRQRAAARARTASRRH